MVYTAQRMRRLLHVENDPLVARAVRRLLRIHQYDVGSVLSCQEGNVTSGSFHVGVMDIDLGDGDGVELARQLMDRGVIRRAVFFTARTDHETTQRASEVGPVISKTAGVEALLDEIAKCFQLRTAGSQTLSRATDADEEAEEASEGGDRPHSSSRSA